MDVSLITIGFLATFAITAFGMWPLLNVLRGREILDHPNERSSHSLPTPKGGGIVLVPVLCLGWVVISLHTGNWNISEIGTVAILALALGIVSWIDDLKNLSAKSRLIAHIFATMGAMSVMPSEALYFQGLFIPIIDKFLAIVLWIWFVNLFNFMDGIDGISGIEALSIGLGVFVIGWVFVSLTEFAPFAAILMGAAIGFLLWNWAPAKIFLGDVGSVPLGFLLGWLLLTLAASGAWGAALILPAYYLADATFTLVRRVARGERAWLAHREHFYQNAALSNLSHRRITLIIFLTNALLVLAAIATTMGYLIEGFLGAGMIVSITLVFFGTRTATETPGNTE